MIVKIREIMNGKTIGGKSTNETMIINAIVRKEFSDDEIKAAFISFVKKGSSNIAKLLSVATEESKKLNRIKHTFNSYTEYQDFAKNNNCGTMWEENGKICVYKY